MVKRKRSTKKVALPANWRPSNSRRKAREVTTMFHKLRSEASATLDLSASVDHLPLSRVIADETSPEIKNILRQFNSIGGLRAYQAASVLSTSANRSSSKYVFQTLAKLKLRPRKGQAPVKVLEVGAINTQLLCCRWLNVRAIDLRSQHPKIEQIDFFDLVPAEEYDVVVMAMVVNCVPRPELRGLMLLLSNLHLKMGGHYFIALPRRCLRPSAGSMSTKQLITMMSMLGLDHMGPEMSKESPKIVYHAFVKTSTIWPAIPRLCSKYPAEKSMNPTTKNKIRKARPTLATAPPFRISFSASTIAGSASMKSAGAVMKSFADDGTKQQEAKGAGDSHAIPGATMSPT